MDAETRGDLLRDSCNDPGGRGRGHKARLFHCRGGVGESDTRDAEEAESGP